MATLAELITYVERIIQDSSFTESDIIAYLNQAQLEIAGGMQSALGDWITPPLPDLLTIDTVTTSTEAAYVSMPDDFQRILQFAASNTGAEIDIEDSFIEFVETYPLLNQSGSITMVIEKGNNFYYQGIPSESEDVTIHYYKYPTDMSSDDDEPDGIPKHLQKSLLVNHACWKIYELIEDGLEGPGVNTQRYMGLFFQALKVLELSIPYSNRGMNVLQDK